MGATKKPHYTKLLKAFIAGELSEVVPDAQRELARLALVKYEAGRWYLTKYGEERARRLGYLPKEVS